MAFEDLFGNNMTTSAGNMTPDPSDFTGGDPTAEDSEGFDFAGLFEDQNFIRGLGETGSAISSGESIGKAVGDAASNLTRRRAFQKGAQDVRKDKRSFQEKLLGMLSEGNLLSAKDQNDAFDTLSIDGDGNVNLGMKNTPQKAGFQKNQALESMRRPSPGGTDLPNFSNQPGKGEFDFAGLDPEDISLLLKAEQQFGQLDQNQMKMILDEKNKRKALILANKNRTATLAQIAADREEKKRQFKVESTLDREKFNLGEDRLRLDQLKEKNKEEMNPAELERHTLELENLQSQIDKRSAEIGADGITPVQQSTIDKNNADLERKETELGMKLDELEKEEFFSIQPSYVDDKGKDVDVPFEEREANANQSNNRPNNKIFYHITPQVEDAPGVHVWGTDIPGQVIPIFLPKHPTTGKQITSSDVIDTAKANKISPEEVLRQWGLIK